MFLDHKYYWIDLSVWWFIFSPGNYIQIPTTDSNEDDDDEEDDDGDDDNDSDEDDDEEDDDADDDNDDCDEDDDEEDDDADDDDDDDGSKRNQFEWRQTDTNSEGTLFEIENTGSRKDSFSVSIKKESITDRSL